MSAKNSAAHAIDGQLTPNNVLNPALLAVINRVDRGDFVPEAYKDSAYIDQSIALGPDRMILAPLTQAHLLEAVDAGPQHNVLYIAGTKGYGAAVLAHIAKAVYVVEELTDCAEHARRYFSSNRKLKVEVFTGSLAAGHPENAPYDRIVIEGAVDYIPQCLLEQMTEDGKCVAVKRVSHVASRLADLGRVATYTLKQGKLVERLHQEVFAPILPGFEKQEEFSL